MLKEFEIHWDDLTEECQKRLEKFLDYDKDEGNNWQFESISSICIEVEDPSVETIIQ